MAKQNNEFVWEQLDDESAEAYEAFALYRDLGADYNKRSLSEVAQRLGKSKTLMSRWSARHRWVERAKDYDRYVESKALLRATKGRAAMRERQIKLGQKLQQVGLEALEHLVIDDPETALKLIIQGAKLEDTQRGAEQEAHKPTARDETESEALERLDAVLKEIKSAF